jgi:hypothetical protein
MRRALLAPVVLPLLAAASLVSAGTPAIVGTWTLDAPGVGGATTFLDNGLYFEAAVFNGDPVHTGLEWGSYSWNATTGKITATAYGDANGNWGVANDINGPQYFKVNGNTGSLFQPGCAECSASAMRLTPGASAIVGTWVYEATTAGQQPNFIPPKATTSALAARSADVPAPVTVVTSFFADGHYVQASANATATWNGIEWGTYSWDAATGLITATAIGDLNGNRGVAGDFNGPLHVTVSGSHATFFQDAATCRSVDGCHYSATAVTAAVPEPSSAALMLLGLAGVGAWARRRGARVS